MLEDGYAKTGMQWERAIGALGALAVFIVCAASSWLGAVLVASTLLLLWRPWRRRRAIAMTQASDTVASAVRAFHAVEAPNSLTMKAEGDARWVIFIAPSTGDRRLQVAQAEWALRWLDERPKDAASAPDQHTTFTQTDQDGPE